MEKEIDIPEFYTVRKAAEILGFHVRTVQRLIKKGEIVVEAVNPRFFLIRRSDLEKYPARKRGYQVKTKQNT